MYNSCANNHDWGGLTIVSTEEEIGYRDAIRQVTRSLQRRLKGFEDQLHEVSEDERKEIGVRMNEINHLLHTVESLHR
jgi:flagellar hook-associated protein FlgK